MIIIPAIDIRNGYCVRLDQGKLENETVFSKDPVFMAKLWKAQGAERLHVIDLDGAFSGIPQNLGTIAEIAGSMDIPVQVGGGIRNTDTINKIFSAGAGKAILGTTAIYDTDFVKKACARYVDKIIISIDVRDNKVAIGGWKDLTTVSAVELGKKMADYGIKEIIFTDISKDGMLAGPNLKAIEDFSSKVNVSVIVSGGVSGIDDIRNIMALGSKNITGVIIGKALYTEKIKMEDAIEAAGKE